MALDPPVRPEPAPRGTTGTRCSWQARMTALTWSVVRGNTTANGYVETQPGIFNTELRDHVATYGLWYAPDPAGFGARRPVESVRLQDVAIGHDVGIGERPAGRRENGVFGAHAQPCTVAAIASMAGLEEPP